MAQLSGRSNENRSQCFWSLTCLHAIHSRPLGVALSYGLVDRNWHLPASLTSISTYRTYLSVGLQPVCYTRFYADVPCALMERNLSAQH